MEKIISKALYVVSTPIGHLEDISYRAIHVLKHVDLILCEDTRVTKKLLDYYRIESPYETFHQYNENEKTMGVLTRLRQGQAIALVSDAGTPLISDPGFPLINACINEDIRVIPIGGASALLSALVASGMSTHPFYFHGFLPKKKIAKEKTLESLSQFDMTLVFYESPNRVFDTTQTMLKIFGNRRVTFARELTKKFETFTYTTLQEIEENDIQTKGEYAIVVEGFVKPVKTFNEDAIKEYDAYIDQGLSDKDAMKKVAALFQVSKRDVYQLIKVRKVDSNE
ncbi:MAG: 16S rRNA (cytidine(1402)-2'-O)-methyltransferase [Acholeplasmataceae bacterium]